MQSNEPQEVFDATIETEKIPSQAEMSQQAIDDARIRAEHQNLVTANLVDDMISQKKKSFRRAVVLSVSSVIILLVLAIVFFIYLRWYGVGAGVAILAFVVAQIWLNFFKKWEYNADSADDFGEDEYLQNLEQNEPASEITENADSKNDANESVERATVVSQNKEKITTNTGDCDKK